MAGIGDVLARMEAIDRELPPGDGVRWFNRLYLEVTRSVAAAGRTEPEAAPGFLEQLDLVFAAAYFTALDAAAGGAEPPRSYPYHAWKPLFEARHREGIAPVQFALAGMNAHINHDLAIGVCGVCIDRGVEPRVDSPEHADYEGVNPLIARVERDVKTWMMAGLLEDLDEAFAPADDVVAIWSVERARDGAWTSAELLWHLRDARPLRDDYLEANDHATGLASRALLVPVGLV